MSEKRSIGITKILNALAANGSPQPEFETNDERDYMITSIRIHEGFGIEEIIGLGGRNDINIGDSIGENIGDSIGENAALNVTQSQIVILMRKNPRISAAALAEEIGIAKRNIETNISALKKAGIITREGNAKGGRWKVE